MRDDTDALTLLEGVTAHGLLEGVPRASRYVAGQRDEHQVLVLPDRGIPEQLPAGRADLEMRNLVAALQHTLIIAQFAE